MRSTVPRTRTVSCADAGSAKQTRTKLETANARGNFPTMTISQGLRQYLCYTGSEVLFQRNRCEGRPTLVRLDSSLLDLLAPASFLAEIAVELGWRTRGQHQPLIDAELLEGVGLDRAGCRLVETV